MKKKTEEWLRRFKRKKFVLSAMLTVCVLLICGFKGRAIYEFYQTSGKYLEFESSTSNFTTVKGYDHAAYEQGWQPDTVVVWL